MPRAGHDGSDGGGDGRKRYAATVEKGENAWKREWSTFMSGVSLKRLRDGTSGVALKASADIERQVAVGDAASSGSAGEVGVNSDGIPLDARAGGAGFSYLFSSAAERRAERDSRDRADQERRREERRAQMAKVDPLSVLSKHQRALHDASQRGLLMEGMNRKTRRDFLHLTVTEAQQKAEEQSKEFKLHDLMDEKMAWYQQGPHPVDLIAEKLVRRKAEKRAKQLGLRYNYLAPHASWLAKRAQKRRESLLVGLGRRLVFPEGGEDEAEGAEMTVTDPLRQHTVPLRKMGLLLTYTTPVPATAAAAAATEGDNEDAVQAAVERVLSGGIGEDDASDSENGETQQDVAPQQQQQQRQPTHSTDEDVLPPRLPDVGVLQDPARLATSYVRRVVRDRATAVAIQQMNRTTTFLSSDLVKGPSILPEDTAAARGLPTQLMGSSTGFLTPGASVATAAAPKRPTRASAGPSFSAYAPVEQSMASNEGESARDTASPQQRKRVRTEEAVRDVSEGQPREKSAELVKKEKKKKLLSSPSSSSVVKVKRLNVKTEEKKRTIKKEKIEEEEE